MVRTSRSSLFMADPPSPVISREALSKWHKKAIELVTSGKQQVLYIYGKAGTGKTQVALHICDHYKGSPGWSGNGQSGNKFQWTHRARRVFDRRGQCDVCFRVMAPK